MSAFADDPSAPAKPVRVTAAAIAEFLHSVLGARSRREFIEIGERGWKGIRLRSVVNELSRLEREP